jgi:hypothetical protein
MFFAGYRKVITTRVPRRAGLVYKKSSTLYIQYLESGVRDQVLGGRDAPAAAAALAQV